MSKMFERIESLCKSKGINITQLCRETGVNRGNLSDLKMGRQKGLSVKNADKIAEYFGVSVKYLLTGEQKTSTEGERQVTEEDIKFALFGGDGEITDAMYREVRSFADYVKQREADKKKE